MHCNDNNIKMLLPAYLEEALDQGDLKLVKDHLAACEDCRAELTLLRQMVEKPVPDPGGAFWQTMPERVFRAVQEEKKKQEQSAASWPWSRMLPPRWAWTTATIGLVAAVSWFLVRPAEQRTDIARPGVAGNAAPYDDPLQTEPISVAELSTVELGAATHWAQNELVPMREAVTQDAPEDTQKDFNDDLMELSPRDLDRVLELLNKKEQDARERLRKKTAKEKDVG